MADFKVKCIKEKRNCIGGSIGFTEGKVYEIKNGKLIDNDKVEWPIFSYDKFLCLEDIKNYKNGNWSYCGEFIYAEKPRESTLFRSI